MPKIEDYDKSFELQNKSKRMDRMNANSWKISLVISILLLLFAVWAIVCLIMGW